LHHSNIKHTLKTVKSVV